jgi:uracil-DNA glycosylase
MNLEKAIEIAVSAHKGQVDKANQPYILHPLRLMLQMDTEVEQIVAVLHDVVEDASQDWNFQRLQEAGFANEVIQALRLVTHNDGSPYMDYVKRIRENPIAKKVKLADLRDNMDLTRIPNVTEKDLARIRKYAEAHSLLMSNKVMKVNSAVTPPLTEHAFPDRPKLFHDPLAVQARLAQLNEPHVKPLTAFVEALRSEVGSASIPYFDPWDGGINAECLFLLEAPGRKASTFISRNNDDETAKNSFTLNEKAGLSRKRTVAWNIVPWYIGSETKTRAATQKDIDEGMKSLARLLGLLPNLRAAVLVGRKAQKAGNFLFQLRPGLKVFHSPHFSPLFVNNKPGNKTLLLEILTDVTRFLDLERSSR